MEAHESREDEEYLFSPEVRSELLGPVLRNRPIPGEVISVRGYNALMRNKVSTLGVLAELTVGDFLRMRNVGIKTAHDLAAAIPPWLGDGGSSLTVDAWEADQMAVDLAIDDDRMRLPLLVQLPEALRAQLAEMREHLPNVSTQDVRFGVGEPLGSLERLLNTPPSELRIRLPSIATIVTRLQLLADRVRDPVPLVDELREVLPGDDRSTQVVRSRWGWDGTGPKTLDATGVLFNVTRERIRQIEKKVVDRRLPRIRAYLPTAEALIALLRELGGAAYEDDLGESAVERGLVRTSGEVAALRSLAEIGWISERDLRRITDAGPPVLSLGAADTSELRRIGSVTRRVLRRRGIAATSEVLDLLEREGTPAAEREVRAIVDRLPSVRYLSGHSYFWQPEDANSSFSRSLEKPLAVLGPLPLPSLARALRRASRRETYGPVVPTAVLAEALNVSPFFLETDGRWAWHGPARHVPVGIAEQPLLDLLRAAGPVLTGAEIREALPDVEAITLSLALGRSPLVERVAYGMYALTGARFLPGDVEDARRRMRNEAPAAQLVGHGWEGGVVRIEWDILRPRLWGHVLQIPTRLGLDGAWKLKGWMPDRVTTIRGAVLWGGVGGWVVRQDVQYPARLALRFDLPNREIAPSITMRTPA